MILSPIILLSLSFSLHAEPWKLPEIRLPENRKHPVVACTADELERLKKAHKGEGPEHAQVAAVIKRAERSLTPPIEFPPSGGQHNRWYQCDKCETGLRTIDDTHHQCPLCKKTYTGSPYDDVIYSRKHRRLMGRMTDCAWAFAITGEKKYAELTKMILLGYAERYLKYPYHNAYFKWWNTWMGGHLKEQTLDEAVWLTHYVAPSYDLIHDSGVLSDPDHEVIQIQLIRQMLKTIAKNPYNKVNWQSWHNAGFLWAGAVLGDIEWVKRAILAPKNGFLFQLENSLTDDGFWYETSWGYHFYALQALVDLAEGARRLGIDVWTHPRFKSAFILPLSYTMSNGRLPRFGDDVNSTAVGHAHTNEPAFQAYQDPAMLVIMPKSPSWRSVMFGRKVVPTPNVPPMPSRVFKTSGHGILRTRGEAGLTAAITFAKHGGFHSHFDKLSFVFYGYKQELGVDPGRAANQAYRLPIHLNWYRGTISHNAILVNRQPQRGTSGKLEFFTANDDYAAVGLSCDGAYRGVAHRRILLMTPKYLLVFDNLESKRTKTYDWLYHNRSLTIETDLKMTEGMPGDEFSGSQYIKNRKHGQADENLRVRFTSRGLTTHLVMDSQAATVLTTGDGPLHSVTDRVPMVMITRQGSGARFAAVLEPVQGGIEPTVEGVAVKQKGARVVVSGKGWKEMGTLEIGKDGQVKFVVEGKVVLE